MSTAKRARPTRVTHSVSTELAGELDALYPVDGIITLLAVFDAHFPLHDPHVIGGAMAWARDHKPDVILYGGDAFDNEACSSHGNNSNPPKLYDEAASLRRHLKTVRRENPNAKIIYMDGNHEDRTHRKIINEAPALDGAVDMAQIIGLDAVGAVHVPYGASHRFGSLITKHADYQGNAVAKQHFDKFCTHVGESVMHGHTHRAQSWVHGRSDGTHFGAYSMPCACKLGASYLKGRESNWVQGWAVAYINTVTEAINVYPVLCWQGTAIWNGKEYGKAAGHHA